MPTCKRRLYNSRMAGLMSKLLCHKKLTRARPGGCSCTVHTPPPYVFRKCSVNVYGLFELKGAFGEHGIFTIPGNIYTKERPIYTRILVEILHTKSDNLVKPLRVQFILLGIGGGVMTPGTPGSTPCVKFGTSPWQHQWMYGFETHRK